jgi:HEAT repeat protein
LERALAEDRLPEFWADRDVRRIVAQLYRRDGGPRPEEVRWERFRHAYGPAGDVPGLLHRLAHTDPAVAAPALSTLWNNVRHQGTASAAGPLTSPFLLRIAAKPGVRQRHLLLHLAADLGRINYYGVASRSGLLRTTDTADEQGVDSCGYPVAWSIQAGQYVLAMDTPILLTLLHDPDPRVRISAAYALAAASDHHAHVNDALRQRLRTDAEPAVRISLVLGIAQIHTEDGVAEACLPWARQLWSDPGQPPDVRLGGAIAWLCLTDTPPPAPLLDTLADTVTSSAARWIRDVPWAESVDQHGGLGPWLARLLDDAPSPRLTLTRRLAASTQSLTRVHACRTAYDIAARWRPPTDTAVTVLGELITDPDPYVARTAACLLTRVGDAATTVADPLAAALRHDDLRPWAVTALAHAGDSRAVAPLADLLRQPTNPWPPSIVAPDLHLIDHLHPHAATLIPPIAHRLRHCNHEWDPIVHDLIRGLGSWGAAASNAVTALTDCLTQTHQPRPHHHHPRTDRPRRHHSHTPARHRRWSRRPPHRTTGLGPMADHRRERRPHRRHPRPDRRNPTPQPPRATPDR